MFSGIHHLAFITTDLERTVRFYRDLLGMPLTVCIGEEGFRHYFFRINENDSLAFFQYPEGSAEPMRNTRPGVPSDSKRGFDHVSIGVDSKRSLFELRDKLVAADIPVEGVIDHGVCWSIYFKDPNNLPLEVSWQSLDITRPPVVSDREPLSVVDEGSEPQKDHWPEVSAFTPESDWTAKPGAGAAISLLAVEQGRGELVDE